jgi:eukaryotic-like serine/threonine-protein kinase
MGTVLKVEDLVAKKIRALKYCHEPGDDKKRFDREVRIMQRVKHDHVVPVLHANLDHDPPYFVMLLASNCLGDEIATLKADETAALSAFKQACLGIQALHGAGAVHRDLKPHNLLRFPNFGNRVMVSDLGLAKLEERDTTVLTQTKAVLGTIDYLAPEQFEPGGSRGSDARTDIFQLGQVLYHLLTGRSPRGMDNSLLPGGLAYIVQKATNPLPENRFQSVGQLLDALRYYEISKQESDSREAFESLVQEAEDLLKQGHAKAENVRRLLALLAHHDPGDHRTIIADFDRIPNGLLSFIAGDYCAELLPVLRLYAMAIRARVSKHSFAYADAVAVRMSSIFQGSKNVEVRQLALQTLLIAAVDLNRYYAMEIFNRLLASIRDIGLALPVAEMLRANADHYKVLARGVPAESLQAAIRSVREEALKSDRESTIDDEDSDIYF